MSAVVLNKFMGLFDSVLSFSSFEKFTPLKNITFTLFDGFKRTRAAIANKVLSPADRVFGNALLKALGNPNASHENQQSAIQRLHDLMATVRS